MALDLGYDIDRKDTKGPKALETKASIQENYVRVDIYFQTLNVKSIVQSPLYPVRLGAFMNRVDENGPKMDLKWAQNGSKWT